MHPVSFLRFFMLTPYVDIMNTSADIITLLNQNPWAITYEVSGYFYSRRLAFVMNPLDDESYSIPSLQTTQLIPFMHF
jgi:hypothetical protein